MSIPMEKILTEDKIGKSALIILIIQITCAGLVAFVVNALPSDGAFFWFGSVFSFIALILISLSIIIIPVLSIIGIIINAVKQKSFLLSLTSLILFIIEGIVVFIITYDK